MKPYIRTLSPQKYYFFFDKKNLFIMVHIHVYIYLIHVQIILAKIKENVSLLSNYYIKNYIK